MSRMTDRRSVEQERQRWKRVCAEIFVAMGLLIIGASLAGSLSLYAARRRFVRETQRAVGALLNAGARYRLEYGRWPGTREGQAVDVRFGVSGHPNRRFVTVLRGREMVPGWTDAANPRGIVFWEPPDWRRGRVGVNEFGELLDPWGTPFQIVVDGDLNGLCDVARSVYGSVEAGMLVWSCGPDRRSDTADDIRSW